MRSRVDDAEMRGNIIRHANRFGVSSLAIGANYAIPSGAPHIQVINSGASVNRNVTLPATPKKGDFFIIINGGSGTSVLTVQDSAAGALSPPVRRPCQRSRWCSGTARSGGISLDWELR